MSEWVARAQALHADIAAAQAEMSEARRMPNALAAKFADAGFFRLCVPSEYGGAQASVRELAQTLETLAQADASAAWVAMIGATTGALAAYMAPDAAREVFGDANSIVTGVYAPMGRASVEGDAYRVSGQWKWNSGGQNSHWIAGGCLITENGKPKLNEAGAPIMRMMIVPRGDVHHIDTWHTGGLKGTGSGDMAMRDVLIPQARSVSLTDDRARIAAPLYAFPAFGLLALGIAAVASGNAQGALDDFATAMTAKRTPNGRTLAERGTTQALYAQAQGEYAAARAFLFQEIDAAWAEAESGGALTAPQRAKLRLAATHMTRTAADVIRRLQDFAGGASVFLSDPLQRRLGDAQTATAHIMIAPMTYEMIGRVLLSGEAHITEL